MDKELIRQVMREELAFMIKNKKLVFPYPIQILDGNDITLAKNVGTRIGTASDQKLSVYGATPVIRANAIATPVGGATIDLPARQAIDSIRTALTNFGITA